MVYGMEMASYADRVYMVKSKLLCGVYVLYTNISHSHDTSV